MIAKWDKSLIYPPHPVAEITVYEKAHDEWKSESVVLTVAEKDVTASTAADKAALVAAVAAGKPYPKTTVEKVKRKLEMQEIRTKQARLAATQATVVLRAVLEAATVELLPLVIENIKSKSAIYKAVLAEGKSKSRKAARDLEYAYSSGASMTDKHVQTEFHVGVLGNFTVVIEQPHWLTSPTGTYDARVATVEKANEKESNEKESNEKESNED